MRAARVGERAIPFLKSYTLFNVAQIEGLPDRVQTPAAPPPNLFERIGHAETFFTAWGSAIRHGGNQAYYSGASDHVQMPPFEAFRDAESYYATLAHEHIHWTKHADRLDRDFGRKRFSDECYAREELVAELGSAFLYADLNLTPEPREDHASYIASWLKVLKNDSRFIINAAAHAQKAADFLHRLQPDAASPEADGTSLAA
ncbi:ArdC family protein [Ancylobacter sp. SL191]|uniref:ArdC family protein n=1 Tax=Ancylobacter sp. SL191 TaxID=2995166 RepID=UPI002D1E3AF8|nr:zincin-like metallopeptidase domain-containing protein [Ancylobacter sp. SL191]